MGNITLKFFNYCGFKCLKKEVVVSDLEVGASFLSFIKAFDIVLNNIGNDVYLVPFGNMRDLVFWYNFICCYYLYFDYTSMCLKLSKIDDDFVMVKQKLIDNNFDFSFIKKMVGGK